MRDAGCGMRDAGCGTGANNGVPRNTQLKSFAASPPHEGNLTWQIDYKTKSLHPIGHIGEPEDIAWPAIYLASDESRWCTGASLPIDGGYTIPAGGYFHG